MKFVLDLSLPAEADPYAVADWVLDLLTNQDHAGENPCPYRSADSCEPDLRSAREQP